MPSKFSRLSPAWLLSVSMKFTIDLRQPEAWLSPLLVVNLTSTPGNCGGGQRSWERILTGGVPVPKLTQDSSLVLRKVYAWKMQGQILCPWGFEEDQDFGPKSTTQSSGTRPWISVYAWGKQCFWTIDVMAKSNTVYRTLLRSWKKQKSTPTFRMLHRNW